MTTIIRIPSQDDVNYDRLLDLPEGMEPAGAVAQVEAIMAAVAAADEAGASEGVDLSEALAKAGFTSIAIVDTIAW